MWKNGITAFKVKVTAKVQDVSECFFLDDNFSVSSCVYSISPEPLNHFFVFIKLRIVVYYHSAMCHAEKLVHCLQCQGHSEGLCNQNMTISLVSSKLLVDLQPNLL